MLNPFSEKVTISFRQETDSFFHYKEENPCADIIPVPSYYQRYVMEIRCYEFWADIETTFNPSVSKDVIASCLMAGMKLIPNHEMVYEEVAAQIRSGVGIYVSREVSPLIAEITDREWAYDGLPFYKIKVKDGVGHHTPSCNLEAFYIEEEGATTLEFQIENRGKKMKVSSKHDAYFFKYEGGEIIKEQQLRVISELHQKFPEWGAEWEIFRVQWFGESETMTKNGYDSWFKKPQPSAIQSSTRDPRVDLLPGLSAQVKHAVTGRLCRLEDAIISLNDQHGWSREQVADWLETLDVDITFKVNTENEQD